MNRIDLDAWDDSISERNETLIKSTGEKLDCYRDRHEIIIVFRRGYKFKDVYLNLSKQDKKNGVTSKRMNEANMILKSVGDSIRNLYPEEDYIGRRVEVCGTHRSIAIAISCIQSKIFLKKLTRSVKRIAKKYDAEVDVNIGDGQQLWNIYGVSFGHVKGPYHFGTGSMLRGTFKKVNK